MGPRAWRPRSRRWVVVPPRDGAAELARRLGAAPLIAQILCNRGILDAEAGRAFMNPKLSDLHDPELLANTTAAAERIARAVAERQRIVIYGDYDVDGITGVAILHACLKMVRANVHFYVPHRLAEGYGVNDDALDKLIAEGAQLLITVDCGIGAAEALRRATAAGLDVIVTDHHSPPPPEALPEVTAIVHPQLGDSQYPNADLSGAGVALKLAWQVARVICGRDRVDEEMREFLLNATCLAALGTIADVVPLIGENRSLAFHGLLGLPASKHPGLRALLESANLANEKLDAFHVGFVLAPRINACGRMGHARLAVELLTDAPAGRCRKIAEYLAKQNAERQRVERGIVAQAVDMARAQGMDGPEHRAIVLWSDDWHGGVIGIVASRLVERFAKPAVLIAIDGNGCGQGSARSIPGFHMRDALAACGRHLLSFGGHAMAGGLRVAGRDIPAFAESFGQYARSRIAPEQMAPVLSIDAEVPLSALNFQVAGDVARLAPFGQGNPRPVVAVRRCRVLVAPRRMGRNGGTAGLMIGQGPCTMRAVGFGMGDLADELIGVNTIDVAGEPMLNSFNGRTSVELKLRDVRWDDAD